MQVRESTAGGWRRALDGTERALAPSRVSWQRAKVRAHTLVVAAGGVVCLRRPPRNPCQLLSSGMAPWRGKRRQLASEERPRSAVRLDSVHVCAGAALTRNAPDGRHSTSGAAAPGDSAESVRETLRRADEALKKANQPPANSFVVPAAPAEPAQGEFRRGNLGNSPPADASFGGVSHVLGDNTSPTFRPSVSPQTRFIHVVG